MDGIILQITGCKHWKVYDTPLAVRPLPDTVFKITTRNLQPIAIKETDSNEQGGRGHYDEDKDDEYVTNEERKNTKNHIAPRSRTLKPKVYEMAPGSLLYIPRGFAHEAATNCSSSSHLRDSSESLDDSEEFAPSLHVTFGLETATDTTVEIFIHHYIDILAKHHYPAPAIRKFSDEVPPIKSNISNRSSRIVKESSDSIRSYTVVDSSSNTVTIKEQEDETCVKNSDNQTHSQNATNSSVRILKVLKERINDIGDLEVSADGNEMIIKDDKDAKNFVNLDMNVTEFRKKTSDKEEEGNRAHSGEQSSTSSKHLPLSITLISASSDLAVQMDNISLFDIFHVIVHVATTIDKDLYNCQEHSTTISSNLKDCKRLHEFMTYLEKKKNKKEKFRESPKKNKKRKVTAKSIADASLELSACPSILRRAVAVTKYTANSGYQPMIYDLIPDTVQYLKQFISFYGLPDILQKTLILGLNMGKISINLGNIDFSNNTVTVNKTRGITSNRNSNSIMLPGLNYVKYFISSSSTVHITSGSDIPYVQGMEDRIQGKNQDEYVVAWFQNTLLQTSWGSILVTDGEQKEVDILNLFELFFDDLRNEIGNVEIRPKRDKNGDKGKMDLKTSEIIDVKIRAAEEDEGDSTVSHAYCAAWKEMTHRLEYRRSFREGTG